MLDLLGQELKVNDEVVFISSPGGKRHLLKGFVTAICNKTVAVGREKGSKYAGHASPNQVVKIPQSILDDFRVLSQKHYAEINKAANHLWHLEALGVDNWEGYECPEFDADGDIIEEQEESE